MLFLAIANYIHRYTSIEFNIFTFVLLEKAIRNSSVTSSGIYKAKLCPRNTKRLAKVFSLQRVKTMLLAIQYQLKN